MMMENGDTHQQQNDQNASNTADSYFMGKEIAHVYKDEEFELFLATLSDATIPHWPTIAKACGVDRTTIARWRKHPLAKEAIRLGFKKALDMMQATGGNRWQMWAAKAQLLGAELNQEEIVEADDANTTRKVDELHNIGAAIESLATAIRDAGSKQGDSQTELQE